MSTSGLVLALSAYGLWGFLPLYFLVLAPTSALEIVAWRVALSLAFCVALVLATGALQALMLLLRNRRILALSAVAGFLIAINWMVYVYASTSGFVVEAALGYFITPIVSIALGVLFLRERLRPAQWVAVGLSVVAVVVLAIGYGSLPWIALSLAASFGVYGYVKNRMGSRVGAVAGLTLETAWLAPIALIVLIGFELTGVGLTFGGSGLTHAVLLGLAGVITAVPLGPVRRR